MKVNEIELASNLAHDKTVEECLNPLNDFGFMTEDDLYIYNDDQDCSNYKEEVQDIFNKHYDYFLNEIEKCQEKNSI